MFPVVIAAPPSVVTPADAKSAKVFAADDGDTYIALLLSIAQAQIDGPAGWLGRAIGLQTLEVVFDLAAWDGISLSNSLPYPPFVDVISDSISGDRRLRTVQYRAGYGSAPAQPLPVGIKHAIILMAGTLRDAVPSDEGALKTRTVDGVGSWTYALPDGAADAMQKAADALLAPYRVYRL